MKAETRRLSVDTRHSCKVNFPTAVGGTGKTKTNVRNIALARLVAACSRRVGACRKPSVAQECCNRIVHKLRFPGYRNSSTVSDHRASKQATCLSPHR